MRFKIDTKEKFHVITLNEPVFSANIAAELKDLCTDYPGQEIKNIVLKLPETDSIENEIAAECLSQLQQYFYENNASFVICEVKPSVEAQLEEMEFLEMMNTTPTESEAWDMVQMEEIEREFLDDDENEL